MAITGRGDLERALELYQPQLVIHVTVATYKLAKSQFGDAIRPDPTLILKMAPVMYDRSSEEILMVTLSKDSLPIL